MLAETMIVISGFALQLIFGQSGVFWLRCFPIALFFQESIVSLIIGCVHTILAQVCVSVCCGLVVLTPN